MGMTVNFYTFGKKLNSTARPSAAIFSADCLLKDNTSVLHPVLFLQGIKNPSKWNYAYIPDFDRYYWCRWTSIGNNIWEAELDVDAMASWKQTIGGTSAYVLRSSYAADGNIPDTLYATKGDVAHGSITASSPWKVPLSSGSYVLGVLNLDSVGGRVGAVSYYVFTQSQLDTLLTYLMGTAEDWDDGSTSGWADSALKTEIQPLNYITSCMWFPFSVPQGGSAVRDITFGWWRVRNINCHTLAISGGFQHPTETINIPKHPDVATRGAYVTLNPYSKYTLIYPPFGEIPLDTTKLIGKNNIYIHKITDCVTGSGKMNISLDAYGSEVIATYRSQVGVNIQLAQISKNVLGVASAAVSGIGNIVTNVAAQNYLGATVGMINTIGDVAQASMPQVISTGQGGSVAEYSTYVTLQYDFIKQVPMNNKEQGRPLCQERTISSLPGYIQVMDGDVKAPGASDEELSTIKSYMEGGFFYE